MDWILSFLWKLFLTVVLSCLLDVLGLTAYVLCGLICDKIRKARMAKIMAKLTCPACGRLVVELVEYEWLAVGLAVGLPAQIQDGQVAACMHCTQIVVIRQINRKRFELQSMTDDELRSLQTELPNAFACLMRHLHEVRLSV
jgi:hypothetical protein